MGRLLDLFCGAGGAAVGYARAGFEVVGVDLVAQPHYPFDFVQFDALDALDALVPDSRGGSWCLADFDAIHASPPCQRYSSMSRARGTQGNHPDLVEPVRDLLRRSELPYVIENVPGAPLFEPVVLCGQSYGLRVRRHRLFECSFPVLVHPCSHTRDFVGVYGDHPQANGTYGNDGCERQPKAATLAEGQAAMGIDWMSWLELRQAIPPAYTEHIGGYLLAEVKRRDTNAPAEDTSTGALV